jgi:hypothetical protein
MVVLLQQTCPDGTAGYGVTSQNIIVSTYRILITKSEAVTYEYVGDSTQV